MNAIVRWLLMALASALAGAAAHWFEGSCPLDASSWVCGHWDLVVAVATFVLGAFGVKVNRKRLEASKAAQKVGPPIPIVFGTERVEGTWSTTAPEGTEFTVESRDPSEFDWDKRDG